MSKVAQKEKKNETTIYTHIGKSKYAFAIFAIKDTSPNELHAVGHILLNFGSEISTLERSL